MANGLAGQIDFCASESGTDSLVRGLRQIVRRLHDDARQQRSEISERLRHDDDRQRRILLEMEAIAAESDGTLGRSSLGVSLASWLSAPRNTIEGEAADRYLYRVAYFAMTRLLLVRIWEDIGLIDQTLGGRRFAESRNLGHGAVSTLVGQAFELAGDRYAWLYRVTNNYTWYQPAEHVLIDVLDELSPHCLAELSSDVLGPVYEEYLDTHDRKNKGQYYTPRSVVSFIWDRVGFTEPQTLFRGERGTPRPRVVLDFCTGSGGFLVEAARRIREAVLPPNLDRRDPKALATIDTAELKLTLTSITEGLRGCEITPFAYYLTEVNLLIQLTPVLAAMRQKDPEHLPFSEQHSLAVLQDDALRLHNREQPLLGGEFQEPDEVRAEDACHDIVSPTGFKKTVFDWLKHFRQADYVCSNPPYVGEKGHKGLFQQVLRELPYWRQFHQGKMDYLYWFIILGLSKLRDGGRLGYITTAYWHTADGGSKLRAYLLQHAKIVELIDFGSAKIFSDAPGQHNMIVVLEKCGDAQARQAHRPKLIQVKRESEGDSLERRLAALLAHIQNHADIPEGGQYEDGLLRVFWSPVPQASLGAEAWYVFHESSTEDILQQILAGKDPLRRVLDDAQGVVSGADKVLASHLPYLPRDLVENDDVRVGDGIFVLGAGDLAALNLSAEERRLVKQTYKNSAVGRYVIDESKEEPQYLLYITRDCGLSPSAMPGLWGHLQKFKGALERKRECQRFDRDGIPRRHWYELHWPRDERLFAAEKLVTPRRSPRNRFAYGLSGWYENSDLTVLTKKEGVPEGMKYLLGLLNSAVLEYWFAHRGKRKGQQREYYSTPLQQVPIRRIRFSPVTSRAVRERILADLHAAFAAERYEAVYAELAQAFGRGQEDVVHDGIEWLVDEIRVSGQEGLGKVQEVIDLISLDLYGIMEPADRRIVLEFPER